jgi:apolipoprotein N-acyltransferase
MDAMGWFLVVLSGVLAGISYPTVFGGFRLADLGFLAFFAWAPLFAAIGEKTPKAALSRGFVAGLFHYGISMYWLYTAMNSFGGISPALTIVALLLLVIVLSAYFSLIFAISQKITRAFGYSSLWVRPLVWVAVEYLRGHLPMGGMPWSQIAYSQGGFLSFIQIADLTGVYGVTGLLVFFNEVVWKSAAAWRERRWSAAKLPLVLGSIALAGNLVYGTYRLRSPVPSPLKEIQVGIVQGNIPQDEKWQRGAARRIISIFQEGTLALEEGGAQLILWPEASWPTELRYDEPYLPFSLGLTKADVLFGAVTRSQGNTEQFSEEPYFNTALLADGENRILDYYHKVHLVPFGEYVPYEKLFFFAKKMTAQVGRLMPGAGYYPMKYRDLLLGVLICYEDIFPEISREMVDKGAQALINITNDAWYGNSSAAYQHQVFSQFRSVETRRVLLRATNTGISSAVDTRGRVLWQGGLFTREDFLTTLPFYRDRTLYVRAGDWLPFACLGFTGTFLALALLRKNKIRKA